MNTEFENRKAEGGEKLTRVEKSIEIIAPAERIWPLLFWERTPEWYAPFKTVTHTNEIKNAVGETVHVTGEIAGMKAEWNGETTEKIDNERVAWRSIGGSFTGFGSHLLTPTKAGTKVTMVLDYDMPYSVLGKIMDKLRFHKAFEKSIYDGLQKLKDMAER